MEELLFFQPGGAHAAFARAPCCRSFDCRMILAASQVHFSA